MKQVRVSYERKTTSQYWTYATEILDAQGIMHAQKLATDHLKALKKNEDLPIRIHRIDEVIADEH